MSSPTPENFWLNPEGRTTRLGLSAEFTQSLAEDWVQVELPAPGATFQKGDSFGFVQTSGATHDMRAPRGFKVLTVNPRALADAQVVRLSPLGEGWLLQIEFLE